jgi:hypothetical protein
MKKLIGVSLLLMLGACSSMVKYADSNAPQQKLIIDSTVQSMTRLEVVEANAQCQQGNMKGALVFGKRRIGNSEMTTDIVVDVVCVPRY